MTVRVKCHRNMELSVGTEVHELDITTDYFVFFGLILLH